MASPRPGPKRDTSTSVAEGGGLVSVKDLSYVGGTLASGFEFA